MGANTQILRPIFGLLSITFALAAAGAHTQNTMKPTAKKAAKTAVVQRTITRTETVRTVTETLKETSSQSEREAPDSPTGLIVVATGLSLERSMSPRVLSLAGEVLYTGAEASPDYVLEHGVVVYARNLEDARANPRAGARPMILHATARYPNNFRSDPQISEEDAQLLKRAASKGSFLKKFRVIFVVD
jgi:hypothetical protein